MNSNFRIEVEERLLNRNLYIISNDEFVDIFIGILDKHAPLKYKYIRANEGQFMTKELRKEVMLRS